MQQLLVLLKIHNKHERIDQSGLYFLNAEFLQPDARCISLVLDILANLLDRHFEDLIHVFARLRRCLKVLQAIVGTKLFSLFLCDLAFPFVTFVSNNEEEFVGVSIFVIKVFDKIFYFIERSFACDIKNEENKAIRVIISSTQHDIRFSSIPYLQYQIKVAIFYIILIDVLVSQSLRLTIFGVISIDITMNERRLSDTLVSDNGTS